jgi:hypothetical protein
MAAAARARLRWGFGGGDGVPRRLELGDDAGEAGGVRESPMNEDHGWGWLRLFVARHIEFHQGRWNDPRLDRSFEPEVRPARVGTIAQE